MDPNINNDNILTNCVLFFWTSLRPESYPAEFWWVLLSSGGVWWGEFWWLLVSSDGFWYVLVGADEF